MAENISLPFSDTAIIYTAGTVVVENGSGAVIPSYARLLPAPYVIASGEVRDFIYSEQEGEETAVAGVEVATSGRVLVNVGNKEGFSIGDTLCSADKGQASRMTPEEMKLYPTAILGTIVQIPDKINNVTNKDCVWVKLF